MPFEGPFGESRASIGFEGQKSPEDALFEKEGTFEEIRPEIPEDAHSQEKGTFGAKKGLKPSIHAGSTEDAPQGHLRGKRAPSETAHFLGKTSLETDPKPDPDFVEEVL